MLGQLSQLCDASSNANLMNAQLNDSEDRRIIKGCFFQAPVKRSWSAAHTRYLLLLFLLSAKFLDRIGKKIKKNKKTKLKIAALLLFHVSCHLEDE